MQTVLPFLAEGGITTCRWSAMPDGVSRHGRGDCCKSCDSVGLQKAHYTEDRQHQEPVVKACRATLLCDCYRAGPGAAAYALVWAELCRMTIARLVAICKLQCAHAWHA